MKALDDCTKAEIERLEQRGDELMLANDFMSCIEAVGIYMDAKDKLYAAIHDDSLENGILYPHFKTNDSFCKDWYNRIINKIRKATR